MQRRIRPRSLAVLAAVVGSVGCLSGFRHPLGPPEEGFIEPPLLGQWSCTASDDPSVSGLAILDFDGKQYYLESSAEGESERGRFRAHATRVGGTPFLSVREIGRDEDEWQFLEYDARQTDRLTFRDVDPNHFEDVVDDAPAVRERLAEQLHAPEVLGDWLSCTRVAVRPSE